MADTPIEPSGHQGRLFGENPAESDDNLGFRGSAVCKVVGISYRQLDYWARTGLVEPSIRHAKGSGSQRLYSFRDVLVLKIVKRLLDSGVGLQQIRKAVDALSKRGIDSLSQITILSDGASVYECTSSDEVIDLLQGGQGVFGIAVGRVYREVEENLVRIQPEEAGVVDELAQRRAQRMQAS